MNEEQFYQDLDKERQANLDDVNAAADELIKQAQGNYEYVAKWVEKEFQVALGTDDQALQEFMKKVYSSLEKKIGRIPYDYEKYTNRQLEDYARSGKRLTEDTDRALKIVQYDQQVLRRQMDTQQEQDRQTQTQNLLARGILDTSRDQAGGIAGQAVNRLEDSINLENDTAETQYQRNLDELAQEKARGMEDLTTNRDRNLEDITDQYRREAIDTQLAKDKNLEGAQRELDQQKSQINQSREQTKRQIYGYYQE